MSPHNSAANVQWFSDKSACPSRMKTTNHFLCHCINHNCTIFIKPAIEPSFILCTPANSELEIENKSDSRSDENNQNPLDTCHTGVAIPKNGNTGSNNLRDFVMDKI